MNPSYFIDIGKGVLEPMAQDPPSRGQETRCALRLIQRALLGRADQASFDLNPNHVSSMIDRIGLIGFWYRKNLTKIRLLGVRPCTCALAWAYVGVGVGVGGWGDDASIP